MRRIRWCLWCVLAGCAAGAVPDSGLGPLDAGTPVDAGPVTFRDAGSDVDAAEDAGSDAGSDAGEAPEDAGAPMDAGLADAGFDAGRDAGLGDAGSVGITIDGVIGSLEWSGAMEAQNLTATVWAANELNRMLVTVRGGRLYVAVEGFVETTNAIVAYVDHGFGSATGVANLGSLTDVTGALDDALSVPGSAPYTLPSTFRPDFAWGTRVMGRPAVGFDASMGWRDIATNPADFGWIEAAEAPTACSANACETYIPLSTLGGVAPRTIGLFVRIHNAGGDMSPNQTLPMDDPTMPRTVFVVLTLDE